MYYVILTLKSSLIWFWYWCKIIIVCQNWTPSNFVEQISLVRKGWIHNLWAIINQFYTQGHLLSRIWSSLSHTAVAPWNEDHLHQFANWSRVRDWRIVPYSLRGSSANMFTVPSIRLLLILALVVKVYGLCGDSIRWAHHFNIEDVYGMWYGVGYAQHTPDMTNKPNEVGCVTLHITDVTTEPQDDWLDWSVSTN